MGPLQWPQRMVRGPLKSTVRKDTNLNESQDSKYTEAKYLEYSASPCPDIALQRMLAIAIFKKLGTHVARRAVQSGGRDQARQRIRTTDE